MITHDPLTRPSATGSRRRALATLATLVVALSCTIDSHLDEPLHMLPPVATRAAIVYVDAFYNDALFVIPGDEAVTTAHISLGDPARLTPQWAVPTRDGDAVLHTYSTYARGLDILNGTYHWLDITAKGRDEAELPWPMAWLKRHDEYAS